MDNYIKTINASLIALTLGLGLICLTFAIVAIKPLSKNLNDFENLEMIVDEQRQEVDSLKQEVDRLKLEKLKAELPAAKYEFYDLLTKK